VWANRPEDLLQYLPRPEDLPPGFDLPQPISVTLIPVTVFDNPALLQVNPEYLACLLLSLPLLERERLLGGNWKIRPAAGLYFKREWCRRRRASGGSRCPPLLGSRRDATLKWTRPISKPSARSRFRYW
jgi:hypothetical protein